MKSKPDVKQSLPVEKNLTFRVDPERKIVYETISGFIRLKDLIEFKKKEADSSDFNPVFSIITDIQQVNFNISKNDIRNTVRFFKYEYQNYLSFNRSALVTSQPMQVVVSKLFELALNKDVRCRFKIFSSYEAALAWIEGT